MHTKQREVVAVIGKTVKGVFPSSKVLIISSYPKKKVFIIICLIEIEFNNYGRVDGVLLEVSAPRKKGSRVEVKDWLLI